MKTDLNQKIDKVHAELLKKLDIFAIIGAYLINI